jgi:peptidoglycan hydrolase-like protein with peptidoglycan-binding domain
MGGGGRARWPRDAGGASVWSGAEGAQARNARQRRARGAAPAGRVALLSRRFDGYFGPYTQEAVWAFQEVQHLTVTGQVGSATRKALDTRARRGR